jgi:hypothetical protein
MAAAPALLKDIAKRKGNQLRGRLEIANSSKQKQRRVISLGGLGGGGETSTGVISLFGTNARIDKELTGVNLICEIIFIVLEDRLIIASALYSNPIFIGTVL